MWNRALTLEYAPISTDSSLLQLVAGKTRMFVACREVQIKARLCTEVWVEQC